MEKEREITKQRRGREKERERDDPELSWVACCIYTANYRPTRNSSATPARIGRNRDGGGPVRARSGQICTRLASIVPDLAGAQDWPISRQNRRNSHMGGRVLRPGAARAMPESATRAVRRRSGAALMRPAPPVLRATRRRCSPRRRRHRRAPGAPRACSCAAPPRRAPRRRPSRPRRR